MPLFGSYDWGNGEWMEDFVARMRNAAIKGKLLDKLKPLL